MPHWTRDRYDAVVVGSGPNGLAAAATLAAEGLSVLVVEAADTPGGGARTKPLTLPGYLHDVCSTAHPLAVASPLFKSLGLELPFVHAPAPLAHVLEDGAVTLEASVADTCAQLGRDARRYRDLMQPLVEAWDDLAPMVLGGAPSHPLLFASFGVSALRSLQGLTRRMEAPASGLLAGIAAHGMRPLDELASASVALVLGAAAHAVGWPLLRGGSRALVDALLASFPHELVSAFRVERIEQLPPARAYLFDVSPSSLLRIAGHRFTPRYRRALARFRHSCGVFKLDWALSSPIPWRDPGVARAATVHLSGDAASVGRSEAAVHAGRMAERPFVLLVQPTPSDPTRAPQGRHVGWAYCHVPAGSTADCTDAIEAEVERAAPGFRDTILARHRTSPAALEAYDANYVGGDIGGGAADLRQLFWRPTFRRWSTTAKDIFLCSASTPPGPGTHGMCGYWAARAALDGCFTRSSTSRAASSHRGAAGRPS